MKFGGLLQSELVVCCRKIGILWSIAVNFLFLRGMSLSTTSSWPFLRRIAAFCLVLIFERFLLDLLCRCKYFTEIFGTAAKHLTYLERRATFIQMFIFVYRYGCFSIGISLSCASSKSKNIENIFRNETKSYIQRYNAYLAIRIHAFCPKQRVVISITKIFNCHFQVIFTRVF